MKNILLTGSGGFIGSHLKGYLTDKYNLLTPRSYELNLLDENAVQNYFEENKIDLIIHSASCGVRITPDSTIDEVAKPNLKMFENLANTNCRMITFGSGAEYDKSRPLVNIMESQFGESIPKDPYGYSKYLISKEIEQRDNVINLRIFGIYGFGENKTRVTSCIIDAKLKKEPVVLNQNVKFSFIYIDDFCKIVKHFIENTTNNKFLNVSMPENIEIVKLAEIIGVKTKIKTTGMNKEYTADSSLLYKELGEFKFTDYATGLKSQINRMSN